jgi:hypothetical protein
MRSGVSGTDGAICSARPELTDRLEQRRTLMAADFDIRDRHTWAWNDDSAEDGMVRLDDGFALNLDDPHSFYQYTDGVPYLHKCPLQDATGLRLFFDPRVLACNWLTNSSEEEVYEWAVSSGRVEDQR